MNLILGVLLAALIGAALIQTIRKFRKGGGCCPEHETVARKAPADRNGSRYPFRVKLKIGGMTCDNCAARVANALNGLDGVWARISYETKTGDVRCREKPDEKQIRRTVSQAGYVVMEYTEE